MRFRSIPGAIAVAALLCAFAPLSSSPARADWLADGTPFVAIPAIQVNFHAIADGAGGMFIAWDDSRVGPTDIYLLRVTRAGVPWPGWPATGLPVSSATGGQTAPRLARDGAGGVYVGFVDQATGAANADIRLQRVTGGGAIAPGWPDASIGGVPVCQAPSRQYGLKMLEDSSGGVYLSWLDMRFGSGLPDVAFTRMLADGSIAPGWPDNGLDPFNEVQGQDGQVMLPDGSGGMWVGLADGRNFQFSPTLGYDINVTHMDGNGTAIPPYPASGLWVTAITGSQATPAMLPDGAGGLLFAFRDTRTGSAMDVSAQRMDANNDIHAGWPLRSSAAPLSNVTGDQDQPNAVSDGAGGMIVLWRDSRTSPSYRLYATRITGAGTIAPGWTTAASGGTRVCPVEADQQHQVLLEDGTGGAYVAWRDQRAGAYDIYATRLTSSGSVAPGWPADGIAVSAAPGAQQTPQLLPDGSGGAYVVWSDYRTDSGDIYGAHLTPAGLAPPSLGVTQAVPSRLELRLASPSPSLRGARLALALPSACEVHAAVLDAAGRLVRALASGAFTAGAHTLAWDGLDDAGSPAAPGLYFVSVTAGSERTSARLVVAR